MLQWMSAKTVHMCHDVLVTELVGLLGACMKWMSMSKMHFLPLIFCCSCKYYNIKVCIIYSL